MKSLYTYIVEPLDGRLYNNIKKVEGGELITSSSIENHTTTNRYAIVLASPEKIKTPVLKNAAAAKKMAIFDAFDILDRIQLEENKLIEEDGNVVKIKPKTDFLSAEERTK